MAVPAQDLISGNSGVDNVDYSDKASTQPVTVSVGDDPVDLPGNDGVGTGAAGNTEGDNVYSDVENIVGGAGNDTLTGQDRVPANYDPTVFDNRSGQEGAGVISGGPGNDTLNGKQDADTLFGGDGVDTVTYANRTSPVRGTIGDDLNDDGDETDVNDLTSRGDNIGPDVERVISGAGSDVLRGNGLDNLLDGGGGNDTINGGAGSDDLRGGAGNDLVRGSR